MSDLHTQLNHEWTKLLEQLCGTPIGRLAKEQDALLKKAALLQQLAEKIGGSALADVSKLVEDVRRFLSGQLSLAEAGRMMKHALRVEQDTREL